jgi:pyruvate/2-oxoglutarate dehydrogenase complex dihydrolipoamide acyltransferase (E2) component
VPVPEPSAGRSPGDPGGAGAECLHGVVDTDPLGLGTPEDSARGTTSFPMNLGQAAAFDPALVRAVAAAISDEARAKANVYRATTGTVRCARRARRRARRSGRDLPAWADACVPGRRCTAAPGVAGAAQSASAPRSQCGRGAAAAAVCGGASLWLG